MKIKFEPWDVWWLAAISSEKEARQFLTYLKLINADYYLADDKEPNHRNVFYFDFDSGDIPYFWMKRNVAELLEIVENYNQLFEDKNAAKENEGECNAGVEKSK